MKQPTQNPLRADHAHQVAARLATLLALTLDIADQEAAADELAKVGAAHQHLPSRLERRDLEPVARLEVFEGFGLDQGDVAGVGVGIVEIAIALDPAPGVRDRLVDLVRKLAVLRRDVDGFDDSLRFCHVAHILAAAEV